MIRFAVAITSVELVLTLGAALWITFEERDEPFVAAAEFEMLGIPVEKHSMDRRTRSGGLVSFDTQAVVKGPGPALMVSLRVKATREEFDARRAAERPPEAGEGKEQTIVNDESWPQEPGYVVRERGRNGVRSELVRLHGSEMLVVRAIRMDVPAGKSGEEVSTCERLARIVQEFVMSRKLGWRDEPGR